MSELCVKCVTALRPRQEAILCNICSKLTHRVFNTGCSLFLFYGHVFRSILGMLPTDPAVKEMVVDFEDVLWRALRGVFNKPIHNYAFHWGQAVWCHVQELGLQANYNSRDSIYKFVRKIFSLPFLPEEQIVPTFYRLKEKATEDKLMQLMTYVETIWNTNQTWLPSVWTVFMRADTTVLPAVPSRATWSFMSSL